MQKREGSDPKMDAKHYLEIIKEQKAYCASNLLFVISTLQFSLNSDLIRLQISRDKNSLELFFISFKEIINNYHTIFLYFLLYKIH